MKKGRKGKIRLHTADYRMKRRIRLLRQEKPDSQKGDGGKKAYRSLYGKQKRKRVSFFF